MRRIKNLGPGILVLHTPDGKKIQLRANETALVDDETTVSSEEPGAVAEVNEVH